MDSIGEVRERGVGVLVGQQPGEPFEVVHAALLFFLDLMPREGDGDGRGDERDEESESCGPRHERADRDLVHTTAPLGEWFAQQSAIASEALMKARCE